MSTWTGPQAAAAPVTTGERAQPHLPAGAHVYDRRGLTAAGAATLALALGLAGALVDTATGHGLRTAFAVCFVLGSALAALLVHREDLRAAVVMPPLVYSVLALVAAALGQAPGAGSVLKTQGLELASALVLGAPVLVVATVTALVISVVRGVHGRRARTTR